MYSIASDIRLQVSPIGWEYYRKKCRFRLRNDVFFRVTEAESPILVLFGYLMNVFWRLSLKNIHRNGKSL